MTYTASVVGGGPAGLMAAETLARAGVAVTVFEQMPSLGRKLLMAGRGGLNLTHGELLANFLRRYGAAQAWLAPIIEAFPPEALIGWCNGLGQETFVGSSSRVFPKAMKASPLLRAWFRRLAELGVVVRVRHRWAGWDEGRGLRFETPDGVVGHR
ncbi:MAG TPA: NAD(P)/FAD-dependent oxidoreductase, partial [Rhodopila sp.]|nr:NAD(P)/FAD-dependent oxidoreductase [Rhodopila sp.]